MVRYRRNFVAGGTYFFTLALSDRRTDHLVRHAVLLRDAFRRARMERRFRLDAIVVLPEHLHAVLTLPVGDSDYPTRWRAIKARFTRAVVDAGVAVPRDRRGEYRLWQPRYWEHTIRDEIDLERHVDYVHFNPVKHGLVTAVRDWRFSSFHAFVRRGILRADWGDEPEDPAGGGGERR